MHSPGACNPRDYMRPKGVQRRGCDGERKKTPRKQAIRVKRNYKSHHQGGASEERVQKKGFNIAPTREQLKWDSCNNLRVNLLTGAATIRDS